VATSAQLEVVAGMVTGRHRVAVRVPAYVAVGEVGGMVAGPGELALDTKHRLTDARSDLGFSLGGHVGMGLDQPTLPVGTGGATYGLRAIGDLDLGDTRLAINLGYEGGTATTLDNVQVGEGVIARFGAGHALSDVTGYSVDLASFIHLGQSDAIAAEILGGGWIRLDGDLVLRGGLGMGLTDVVGSPSTRTLLMLAYEPRPTMDADGDGFVYGVDGCPELAEDFDGIEDGDGCPEAGTPAHIFVRDPYGGAVEDAVVWLSGPSGELEGGSDWGLVLDEGEYEIRVEAPDYVSLEDDGFRVVPGTALQLVKVLTPSWTPPPVVVTQEEIKITEKIYFETGSSTIKEESHGILDLVGATLVEHEEVTQVRIEGHTDSRGDDDYNQALSEDRAQAVRIYLMARGVEAGRLVADGQGEADPIDPRETELAWERNRRVQFIIEARSE